MRRGGAVRGDDERVGLVLCPLYEVVSTAVFFELGIVGLFFNGLGQNELCTGQSGAGLAILLVEG